MNSRIFFFFNDTATTEIYTPLYTLSLHDALPIFAAPGPSVYEPRASSTCAFVMRPRRSEEHTSELQSHSGISNAVFCLKKKKGRHRRGRARASRRRGLTRSASARR